MGGAVNCQEMCTFCRKPLPDAGAVYTPAGTFHGTCLDTLHAASISIANIIRAFMGTSDEARMDAVKSASGPLSDFLRELSESIRLRETVLKSKETP